MFADRLDVGMRTKTSQRMPSGLLPKELEAKVATSKMSNKTKGIDFEEV